MPVEHRRAKYRPAWKGVIAAYSAKYVRRHHWRVAHLMSPEDARQEAAAVFCEVRNRYGGIVHDAPHFMALYKTSLERRFHDLAERDTRRHSREVPTEDVGVLDVGDIENLGYFATMVRQAPTEVRMVLALLVDAPSELLEAALASWRLDGSSRVINRLLGLPERADTLGEVRRHFGE